MDGIDLERTGIGMMDYPVVCCFIWKAVRL
jgi:hypothetical protein